MNKSILEDDPQFILYKLAIEARKAHYENYEKWMTFYYISVGAILIAYYQIAPSIFYNLFLALVGFVISVFWHLSCKGFKYWTDSWIKVVLKYEKELKVGSFDIKLYKFFSKEVFDKNKNNTSPFSSADISTPKTTLLFSYVVCCMWMFLFFREGFVKLVMPLCNLARCWELNIIKCIIYVFLLMLSTIITYISMWFFLKVDKLKNHVEDTHDFF